MPVKRGRRRKGARLYLRSRAGREPVWVIRDGRSEVGTGCGREDRGGAESALESYLAEKYAPPSGPATPAGLLIADVVNRYLAEHGPTVRRPDFLAATATPLLQWWTGKRLDAVRASSCRAYVAWRTGQGVSTTTAWHDLKTLRAAIHYYHREHGPLSAVPAVTLPERSPPRDRWLTRDEAARLLRAARRWPHVARLILIGLYTGTRPGAILALSWLPSTVGGWVDIEAGVLHRRGSREGETRKRRPPVRLGRRLLAHMKRWKRMDIGIGGIGGIGAAWVIHYQGRPIAKLRRSWASVRTAAGLGADVVPHTLRHTAATWLMQTGTDHYEAAGFLGMSVATLEAVYGHHDPRHQVRAAEAISGAIAGRSR